jgi:predicted CoA-binding protein
MDQTKDNLKSILNEVKTIALVGASSNPERDSYKVMKFLIEKGYEVYPVNPNEIKNKILGKRCYSNLYEIETKIDMVDVFRAKEYVLDITAEAIEINAGILWTQEGIIDEDAASIGKSSGLMVIMNECPKKILDA